MTKDFQIRVEAVVDVEDYAEELWREIETTPEFKQYGDRCRVRSAFFANQSEDVIAIDADIAELKAALFQTNDYPLAQQAILAAIEERRNAKEIALHHADE